VHAPFQVPLHCQRERLLLDHMNGQVRTAHELAAALALPLGRVHQSLAFLREAGVVTWSRKGGWKLAEL
jgi:DNA-binding IclR family transcriptional regulator